MQRNQPGECGLTLAMRFNIAQKTFKFHRLLCIVR